MAIRSIVSRYSDWQSDYSTDYQVSMQGRFLPVRGGGGGEDRSPALIQRRDSTGSITSSISKCDAVLTAFPCRYIRSTISSNSFLRAPESSTAASSLR